MVEISDRSQNAAFVSAAGLRRGARTLSQLSQAAGRQVELTQANLRPQANNLSGLGARVGQMAIALNGIEEARGIVRTEELSDALKRATQRSVNRLLLAESLSNSAAGSQPFGLSGGAGIADIVASLTDSDTPGSAIVNALGRSLRGSATAAKPTPLSIIATAANAAANRKLGDIFDRQLPTRVEAQGRATVEVSRRMLEAEIGDVVIDPANPEALLPTVRVKDAGPASAAGRPGEGFVVKARTGETGGTIAIDVTDQTGDDTRLSIIEATGGAGSDVIFLSGANNSLVRAGGGNDYVMSDGSAEIYGGDGDDILIGNVVFGENGDDVLFGNALAVGGAGADRITMFALDAGDEDAEPSDGLAFGGDGDDIIIGEARISADGGDGADAITLRAGGFANGGAGNDTLTAFDTATLEGGEGNDDILMLAGGKIDGGGGADDITATFYTTVAGGKGSDVVRMNTGGVYQFARGDGNDRVLMGSVLTGQSSDWGKTNKIELSNYARGDVDLFITNSEITVVPRDPAFAGDRLVVTRAPPGDAIDIVFTKDDKTQTLSVTGTTQSLGDLVPVLKPVA